MNSTDDEWETPKELYEYLCSKYGFYPTCDVCADSKNKKCSNYYVKELDGLDYDWEWKNWCNPPHSETEKWVKKALQEYIKHHRETMMIIPANSMCTNYAESCIEPHAEYHPINRKYCAFLKDGKKLDHSRNGYFVVIWRKRNG